MWINVLTRNIDKISMAWTREGDRSGIPPTQKRATDVWDVVNY